MSYFMFALSFPKFHSLLPIPYPIFILRLFSHSLSSNHLNPNPNLVVHDAVLSFNHLLSSMHNNHNPPPIIEFNKILSSIVKLKHFPTAVSLFKLLDLQGGIMPDIVTLSILINCYCHLGHMPLAFSVLSKILKLGYQPDTVTLTTLMKGLCLHGDVKKALHFHDTVAALGYHLDAHTYGTLINGLCKIAETKAALQLLRKIEGKVVKTDVIMYNTIIDSLCKDKLIAEAKNVKNKVRREVEAVVPVMNVKRNSMWKLKQAAGLFHHAGIDATALLFTDEQTTKSKSNDRTLGASHPVDLVQCSLKNVVKHPCYGWNYSCSVGIALPVYSTFKAIESKDQNAQHRCLLYWADLYLVGMRIPTVAAMISGRSSSVLSALRITTSLAFVATLMRSTLLKPEMGIGANA